VVSTASVVDPVLLAWQREHVDRFRKAVPLCNCFACLAARVAASRFRTLPLQLLAR
jgi:hypothetical protein